MSVDVALKDIRGMDPFHPLVMDLGPTMMGLQVKISHYSTADISCRTYQDSVVWGGSSVVAPAPSGGSGAGDGHGFADRFHPLNQHPREAVPDTGIPPLCCADKVTYHPVRVGALFRFEGIPTLDAACYIPPGEKYHNPRLYAHY